MKMRKFTKEEVKKLKVFWKKFKKIEDEFYSDVRMLEDLMQKATGIEDVEFFASDDSYCGIGNGSRTIKLIHRYELEE